ncbi:NAD-dependent protein deacylase [Lacticaseibacillus absianus]|uniref:NAD-dependent protein deacylase n=1 Tax=Lacticaseibacillus absianus TaxID=2729623 RepID=UPI0015C96E79|nr:NAD-dependent protein deacylase [Lacticaseibacillus absianus]
MFALKTAIEAARFVTFLTGAGVSTASGIPDYRSQGGLYAGRDAPEDVLSYDYLQAHHQAFHDWVCANMMHPQARPNVIHTRMAAIANAKGAIVTQNVDGLHTAAGAKHVVEFHGRLDRLYCQTCGELVDPATYRRSDRHAVDGGIIRPGIVLYGEPIAPAVVEAAVAAVQSADLLVVVGTSLQVYPFAGLLREARPAATLVAVNREPLTLPPGAHMVVAPAETVFAQL